MEKKIFYYKGCDRFVRIQSVLATVSLVRATRDKRYPSVADTISLLGAHYIAITVQHINRIAVAVCGRDLSLYSTKRMNCPDTDMGRLVAERGFESDVKNGFSEMQFVRLSLNSTREKTHSRNNNKTN